MEGVDKTQKRMRYVAYEFEKTENGKTIKNDKKELKKEAQALLEDAKANGSLDAYCKEKEVES